MLNAVTIGAGIHAVNALRRIRRKPAETPDRFITPP
jgi:hypothetical protein